MSVCCSPILSEQVKVVVGSLTPMRGTKLAPGMYEHDEPLASRYFTSGNPKGAVRLFSNSPYLTWCDGDAAKPPPTKVQRSATGAILGNVSACGKVATLPRR
jgi:hypothetical protein